MTGKNIIWLRFTMALALFWMIRILENVFSLMEMDLVSFIIAQAYIVPAAWLIATRLKTLAALKAEPEDETP